MMNSFVEFRPNEGKVNVQLTGRDLHVSAMLDPDDAAKLSQALTEVLDDKDKVGRDHYD